MVARAWNTRTWKAEGGAAGFRVSLCFTTGSKPARTSGDAVSKSKQKYPHTSGTANLTGASLTLQREHRRACSHQMKFQLLLLQGHQGQAMRMEVPSVGPILTTSQSLPFQSSQLQDKQRSVLYLHLQIWKPTRIFSHDLKKLSTGKQSDRMESGLPSASHSAQQHPRVRVHCQARQTQPASRNRRRQNTAGRTSIHVCMRRHSLVQHT